MSEYLILIFNAMTIVACLVAMYYIHKTNKIIAKMKDLRKRNA